MEKKKKMFWISMALFKEFLKTQDCVVKGYVMGDHSFSIASSPLTYRK